MTTSDAQRQPVAGTVEAGLMKGFLRTERQKETDDVYMVHQTGFPVIDLDKVVLRGTPIREWNRDQLEAELLRIGVPGIQPGGGRDGLAIAYARWRQGLDDGE